MAEGQNREAVSKSGLIEEAHRPTRRGVFPEETPADRIVFDQNHVENVDVEVIRSPDSSHVVIVRDWPDVSIMVDLITHQLNVLETLDSFAFRKTENPPSAAWHLRLDGKEYLMILQPTDLPSVKR
jgi:hypothetical protein